MVADTHQIGQRIAARRRAARMTQEDLATAAGLSYAMVRAIERGARGPSDTSLEALAGALGVDASRLTSGYTGTALRVRAALPEISAAIAGYDIPLDPPTILLGQLREELAAAVTWRLAAQYGKIASTIPAILTSALQHLHAADAAGRAAAAALVVSAARTADAVAYKHGSRDLSARLIDVMRWAAAQTGDAILQASVAYTGAETFLAARAYRVGQKALEAAIDAGPHPVSPEAAAAQAALHMRTAVVAARAQNADAAHDHLQHARTLSNDLTEGIYLGTAVGPSSVRIHEVAVAVSLGGEHVGDALAVAKEWKPGEEIPAERRSGFYVELGRAQLWAGRPDDAFESLKVARRLAPQAVREHPWAREDIETIRRLKRADAESLTAYAEWIGVL
ncbi:helix-turn-helix domain-containing protein [Streptomyces sp. ISL-94]|uniref:helix-turn-helix domain-containing protein n=1 Tax=Streptomyces sp. ISL-94 TaxID=2819190 RepID=UPI001BE7D190|nr:helix-turn-helix transcriptional regulator [Streptomyces sp. ISL-94]MBT2477673.1 helix-turn-helix transcriptional regulator [Streptomyces sp. ISL-94]